jgi:hypothetical protein
LSASRSQARSKSASESTLSTAVAGADPMQGRRVKPDFSRPLGATRSVMILATLDASVASEQGVAGVNLRFPAAVVRCRTAWTTCVAYAFKSGVPCSHTQRVSVEWCKGCRGQGESVDTRPTDIPLEHRTHTPKKWPVVRSKSQVQKGQGLLVRTGGRLATSRMHVATPSPCSLHCASRSSPHSERTASSWYSCTSPAAASFWTSNGMEYPRYAAGLACDWRWLQTNTHCQCSKQTMAANKQRQGNCGHPGWAGMATSGGSRWVVGWGGGPSHAYAPSPRRGLCSARQQD